MQCWRIYHIFITVKITKLGVFQFFWSSLVFALKENYKYMFYTSFVFFRFFSLTLFQWDNCTLFTRLSIWKRIELLILNRAKVSQRRLSSIRITFCSWKNSRWSTIVPRFSARNPNTSNRKAPRFHVFTALYEMHD